MNTHNDVPDPYNQVFSRHQNRTNEKLFTHTGCSHTLVSVQQHQGHGFDLIKCLLECNVGRFGYA